MSERRGFKDQITDVLTESLPDPSGGTLEKWLAPTTESRIEQIPIEHIRDRAVRGDVDITEPAFRALRASIRASGVLQPLLLRPHSDGGYEVVSGARRLRAARDTAQGTVPAVVRELNDVQALVGGSWDAVLRSGLSPRESQALVAQLVAVGMGEGEAAALVGTAPVRDEPVEVADAQSEAEVAAAIEAMFEPEITADTAADAVAEPETSAPVEALEEIAADDRVAAPSADAPAEAAVDAAPHDAAAEAPAVDDVELDEDALGWPAPDEAPAATAPTTPPTPLPIDPTPFPVTPVDADNSATPAVADTEPAVAAEPSRNGDAPPEPLTEAPPTDTAELAAEAPEATAEAPTESAVEPAPGAAVPDAADVAARDAAAPAITEADEPAVVVAPTDASAAAGVTPHVIRINLPDASTAVADATDAAAEGSMPVAAPAMAHSADPGSRLLTPSAPAEAEPAPSSPRRTLPLPALLRRGPLFYAVIGIGLAVGAIVFILTSVLEGVGGTTSIIAAVVVAVVGFVTAMVSLAQPRQRP
jgi:ParB/RepB/Spo0J family partition protein